MISPSRLAHMFLKLQGRQAVVAWVEGGGRPILLAPCASIEDIGDWAIAEGAAGVLVRRVRESGAYWWGPGVNMPFNKADLLLGTPPERDSVAGAGRLARVAVVDVNHGSYVAYWSDRAWSSLHPERSERRRRLFDGELEEIVDKAEVGSDEDAAEVVVTRYDMFQEGEPHARGMIRNRRLQDLDVVVSDAEDAINPNFHAGPPEDMALEPPS